MKHNLLNKLLSLTLLIMGGAILNPAWGETYTLGWGTASGATDTYTNFTETYGNVSGIVSFSSAKNDSGNAPAYNSNSKELRLYYASNGDGGSITLTPESGITITGFVMTTSTSPSVKYTVNGGTATEVSASSNTYTVSGISATSSLKIQNTNTSNTQLRIKTIQINYTVGGGSFGFSPTSLDVNYGDESVDWPTLINPGEVTVSYSSSVESVATVNSSTGDVSIVKPGKTIITATDGGSNISSYTLTINKGAAGLSFTSSSVSTKPSTAVDAPTLTNPHSLSVTYSTSDADIADVNASTGALTIGSKEGTATITASFAGNEYYDSGNASYTVTVSDLTVAGIYVAVTSNEDLVAGDKYIIVCDGETAMSTTQNANNRGYTNVSLTNDVITLTEDESSVAVVKLGGITGAWTLQTLSGYLQSPSKNNYLTCSETSSSNNQKWTITPTEAKTTIKNNENTSYSIQYNPSSKIFSCYSSSQKDVQLYHKIVLEDAELSFASSTANATYGSSFSGPVLTNENSAPLTWTSSNKTVATINSSGEVTLLKAGETIITATATGRYTGNASYTLTVNRAATSLSFAASTPSVYVGDATYTQTATIAPAGADNTISYDFVGEHGTATIDSNTGTVTFNSYEGILTIEATAAQTNCYAAPTAQRYTLTVVGNKIASLALSSTSESTIYGTSVTIDATFADEDYLEVDGAGVTATGYNSDIATYSFNPSTKKITFTPKAVGSTTFTFQANEVTGYDEGSTVNFTITVNKPAGLTKTSIDFDFTTNEWGLPTNYDKTETEITYTHSSDGYSIKLYGASTTGFKFSNGYLIMGKSGAYLTLPAFDKTVTKIKVVGKSGASTSVKQNIYVGETAVSTETIGATDTHEYEIAPAYQAAGNIYTLKVTSSANTQITKIVVYFATPELTKTLNSSGYATFCSEYPLDFTGYATADYSAWEITDISESEGVYTLTFNQLTGTIKGGQGILLKGTPNATVTLTSANSTTVLEDNKLEGTLAPTYVEAGEYYGLSGQNFVPVAESTVPAGKALLPASALGGGGSVKAFNFVFEDNATGIHTVETVSPEEAAQIFDLSGRRLNKVQKGINIVNGKKVLY